MFQTIEMSKKPFLDFCQEIDNHLGAGGDGGGPNTALIVIPIDANTLKSSNEEDYGLQNLIKLSGVVIFQVNTGEAAGA